MPPQTRSTTQSKTRAGSPVAQRTRSKVDHKRKFKSDPKDEPEPQRKRARRGSVEVGWTSPVGTTTSTSSTRPEVLTNLPVELFMQITKYLRPLELLQLSRVNKSLHRVLMNPQASSLWSSAQLNVPGLPPCPPSLCEPQYACFMFTKECSICGKPTSCHMDLSLLVRLCVTCRRHQAVDASRLANSSLVFTSPKLMAERYSHIRWCLLDDALATEATLAGLAADPDAEACWVIHRQEEIHQRRQISWDLKCWFAEQARNQKAELKNIKDTRQNEVELRLMELGWEREDFQFVNSLRRNQWHWLVYNTKSLNDRAWGQLLPYLLGHLKKGREERVVKEKNRRRDERDDEITSWLRARRDETGLFAVAIREGGPPAYALAQDFRWGSAKYDVRLLLQALPSLSILGSWCNFESLADTEMSVDELTVRLDEQRDAFATSITNWRNKLENALLKILPADTVAPGYDQTPCLRINAGSNIVQLFTGLSATLRKLIRADSVFASERHEPLFYPEGYAKMTVATPVKYHKKGSKVAKALLKVLGLPDASYLELKAMGNTFRCGRCNEWPEYMDWKSLVNHYLKEELQWKQASRSHRVRHAKDFVFVFTHDIDLAGSTRPLVRIVPPSHRRYNSFRHRETIKCNVCLQVGIRQAVHWDYMRAHLRDVHMVKKAVQGTHYLLCPLPF